ncbi:MAG: DUF4159 domain-containing protein, partial [Phycisphaerae bacterium]
MKARLALPAAALLIGFLPAPATAQDVEPQQVRRAIRSAVDWLMRQQMRDGGWPYLDRRFRIGADSLVALALLNAGVPADDPGMSRALHRIAEARDDYTYNIALKIAALAQADPKGFADPIQKAARRLARMQLSNGMWTYSGLDIRTALSRGDNSNAQFALYGLHEAARAGARIDAKVWRLAATHWATAQRADGSWSYTGPKHNGYGSMTAAGVASLIICGESVARSREKPYRNGAAQDCGRYVTPRPLAAGLNWLAKNFDVRRNPNHHSYHYYWLYALERAGMLSGLKYFGEHDWFREGAAYLVGAQRGDGSWNRSLIDTSFGLLFLAKGRRPVLFNKLRWSRDRSWNLDRHDCENLVAFISDALGEPVTWQVAPLDGPLAEWLDAPILYFNGHEFPRFSQAHRDKLRKFVEAGGTILAEACCSRAAFQRGFERFVSETFAEYPLRELGSEHPVWTALHAVEPGVFPLYGIDVGCRTSVFFAPTDLSCLWEQAGVPKLSEQAFQLGTNIAAYATGREPLRDRLDLMSLPEEEDNADGPAPPPTTGLRIAQIVHNGDWRTDPHALPGLARYLADAAGVDVVPRPIAFLADDRRLMQHPIAYMTGHFSFELPNGQRDALKEYLTRGGFLFADACCGRTAFDTSFRELCAAMFPDNPLAPLPAESSMLRGAPGFDLSTVTYRPLLREENPGLNTPKLKAVVVDGRAVIVYSRYGFTCGLEGHQCYACRGLVEEDAKKLAANI